MRFILLFLLSFSAHAMDVEVCAGSFESRSSPNGTWWQQGFENTRDLTSPSYCIGVSDYINLPAGWPATRWRAAYSRLGHAYTSATGTTDEDYNGNDGCIANPCVQQAFYTAVSSVSGFSLTVAPEKYIGGGFKGFVEAGVFVYLMKFRAQMAPCRTCSITWDHQRREGWDVAPQLGFGVEYVPTRTQFYVTYRKIDAPTNDPNSVVNTAANTVETGLRQLF